MKTFNNKYLFTSILFAIVCILFTASCSNSNDDSSAPANNELSGLTKIQEISDDSYTFLFYTKSGSLTIGYNEIYLQVKNKSTGELEKNASLSWQPMMQMPTMSHSCPYSAIEKASGSQTLYKGFIIFQMASSDTNIWHLTVNYNIGSNETGLVELNPNVSTTDQIKLQSFMGNDGTRYVLALVEPSSPKVGSNDMTAYLYKMQDTNTFIPIENYTIKIDPRMPAMGHGSSGNVNLTSSGSGLYSGKVGFTMSGEWQINLIVLNSNGEVISGEEVTDNHLASSLFFDLKF